MDLNKLKEQLNKLGFSPEALIKINEIMDRSIEFGSVSAADKERLLSIIDLEIEASDIEADALEEVALALDEFVNGVDNSEDMASDEYKSLEEEFDSETK